MHFCINAATAAGTIRTQLWDPARPEAYPLPQATELATVRSMGMFGKKADEQARGEVLAIAMTLLKEAGENPAGAIARIANWSEHPITVIAEALLMLVQAKIIKAEDLGQLGIDEDELTAIVGALQGAESLEAASHGLQVNAAMSVYERQVDDILREKNLTLTGEQRETFRSNLAQFAYENGLTDLKLAHRLMSAEGGDPLRPPTSSAGYL